MHHNSVIHGLRWKQVRQETNAEAGIFESSDAKASHSQNYKKNQSPSLVLRNAYILLRQPGIFFFATQFFIFGFVMVLADCILYMQLEQEFNVSRKFNGLTTLISTLSALPTYWFAEKLLNTRGALYMLRTAQKIAMLRFLCTGFLNERLLFLLIPLQLLHGISFAMNWSAGVEILQSAATPLIVASVSKLSFFVSTYENHILSCVKLLTYFRLIIVGTSNCYHLVLYFGTRFWLYSPNTVLRGKGWVCHIFIWQ